MIPPAPAQRRAQALALWRRLSSNEVVALEAGVAALSSTAAVPLPPPQVQARVQPRVRSRQQGRVDVLLLRWRESLPWSRSQQQLAETSLRCHP